MISLEINKFSCIERAVIEIAPITLLIGPQASGKSVVTKLLYYFNDILQVQYIRAEEGDSIVRFKKFLSSRFKDWFPVSAWGNKAFDIQFYAGTQIHYRISRQIRSRKLQDEVTIEFSPYFEQQYNEVLNSISKSKKVQSIDDEENFFGLDEQIWRSRQSSQKSLYDNLKSDFVASQTFIPAGRSFFTNLGKAVALLEHGNQLDEMTRSFGRTFTSLLDGNRYYYSDKPTAKAKEFLLHQKNAAEKIFDGSIKITHNDRHVDTRDGRKIPFSILSSGQQELLPLLLILQQKEKHLAHTHDRTFRDMIYVEEPEAHLFPSAQGNLIEYISSISSFFRNRVNFLITTHSPYVISKFNNLIKAYSVAILGDENRKNKVAGIIDQNSWLPPASVNAYALNNGKIESIKDESGLIDGDYLDEISEDLSEKFLSLLEVETTYDSPRVLPSEQQIKNKTGRKR